MWSENENENQITFLMTVLKAVQVPLTMKQNSIKIRFVQVVLKQRLYLVMEFINGKLLQQ